MMMNCVEQITETDVLDSGGGKLDSNEMTMGGTSSCIGFRQLMMMSSSRPNMAAFSRTFRSAVDSLLLSSSSLSADTELSRDLQQGSAGFEELRKYIKQGGDTCKEVSSILQERSETEAMYAKALGKLSTKMAKVAKESLGSLSQAFQAVATELEVECEVHKAFAIALVEDIIKPLKTVIEAQSKARKVVETTVDKQAKAVTELRLAEAKGKKNCYVCARDNERLRVQLLDARVGRTTKPEKDTTKLEGKKRKTEECAKRADYDYYVLCVAAERMRLEWESSVLKGCGQFQTIEEERMQHLHQVLQKYGASRAILGPKITASNDRLVDAIQSLDVAADIRTVIETKGTAQCVSEQMLPDFYAEDLSNAMNKEQRREVLERLLTVVRHDADKERRGKQGVENLARCFHETPTFGDQDAQRDVHEKLQHMRAMLAYFEAARYKLQCCLADVDGLARPVHPLGRHIEQHKDKQGQTQTVLKLPSWIRGSSEQQQQQQQPHHQVPWTSSVELDRGSADGNSHSPDSYDEFSLSSSGDGGSTVVVVDDDDAASGTGRPPSSMVKRQLSLCKALYNYEANLYDELTIQRGDVITVYEKQADGWWHGELNGAVGIFPATYVEEIK